MPNIVAFQDATIWICDGNYGSRVYDPLEGNVFLEAVICDACLVRKKGLIEEVQVMQPPKVVERRPPAF